ncbi:VirB4-like conjugal transfer ATPase, CD1110 family, partial [Streptococcus equi]|uniref:VirB4-like conjugal transfer ATPase, CD1110 family n=1 Tax=Streptococcus equi TaxID=1336 RepID=UPI0013D9D2C2
MKSQLKDRDKELSNKTIEFRKKRESAKTIVDYIGYNAMHQDGICEVEEGLFSASIAFDDTSYHSVRDEQQKAMFSGLTRLYDQFSADTIVQMSVINTPLLKEEVGNRQFFNPAVQDSKAAQQDAEVFNTILNDKVKEGVSNIRRHRYLTYTVNAETAEAAARQLSRIETETSRIFSTMGSKAHLMNGTERLSVIHSLLNPYKPFYFDYQTDISAHAMQTTKDCIAPTQIDFKPDGMFTDCFKLDNGVYGQVLVIKKFGSELSDRALADIVDLPIPMAVTWFVQPMEKSKAINFVRTRSAWIDKEIIEEQRSAVNKGYDFSILPQELKYSKDETEDVLDHLQNKNQRLYVFTGLIYTYAESKEQLDNQVMQIISSARQNSIEVDTYEYRQRRALNSILPLGHNHVEISRMFTTAQVAILVPFATQELDEKGGNYYGQNKHSKNLVICNRKNLTSPMGFVCGKTGSGKGMFVKTEMTGTIFSNPTDEIFIIDRAGEYTGITDRYGGATYRFGVGTNTYLNPFDTVSVEHLGRSEQIAFKIDAMLAQAGASAAEAGQNLSETDQSIIQRCVELAFARAVERSDNLPPTLQDFYDIAKEQPESQAQNIALRYERFVKGAMDFFNHQSNTDFNSRIIDFNLKDLPDSMLVFALINVCEAVRNRMYYNAKRGVRTWLYVEEMQSLFAYPTVLNYFSRFSNEGRKFGLLLTGITQNAVAMLNN